MCKSDVLSDVDRLGPRMVLIPPGRFVMGSPEDEPGRLPVEGPQREVTIAHGFEVGACAVTVGEYAAFVDASGHATAATCQQWDGAGWQERAGSFLAPGFAQTGAHPAVCVSWHDAQAYVAWLSARTGDRYRLPTEAEWEYAARARTSTAYWWGAAVSPERAHYNAMKGASAADSAAPSRQHTLPVASFAPNPWGLYQVHGNTWEWVEDDYAASYEGAPIDGSARRDGLSGLKALRGGGWLNGATGVRAARRHGARPDFRRSDVGFRVARNVP